MGFGAAPSAPEHDGEGEAEDELGEDGEDGFGEAEAEEADVGLEFLDGAHGCAGGEREEAREVFHDDGHDGEVLEVDEAEIGELGDERVEDEDPADGDEEGPAPVAEDGACGEACEVIEEGGGEDDCVDGEPVSGGDLAVPEPPCGEGERDGEEDPFAEGEAEEVAEDLGEGRHGGEPEVVHGAFFGFRGHAAGDLSGTDDEEDEALEGEEREEADAFDGGEVEGEALGDRFPCGDHSGGEIVVVAELGHPDGAGEREDEAGEED